MAERDEFWGEEGDRRFQGRAKERRAKERRAQQSTAKQTKGKESTAAHPANSVATFPPPPPPPPPTHSVYPSSGKGRISSFGEHFPHTTLPQARQWCFRRRSVKALSQV